MRVRGRGVGCVGGEGYGDEGRARAAEAEDFEAGCGAVVGDRVG